MKMGRRYNVISTKVLID